jgi:hypothetical protein
MGIDRISIALNPFYVKRDIAFNKKGIHSLDSFHYVNLVKHANYFIELQINQEAFEPNLDYKCQVLSYLLVLLRKGYLIFDSTPLSEWCIISHYEVFIIGVIGIEIYIDSAYDTISVQPEASFATINEAKKEEGLYCYQNDHDDTKTFYSFNYDKKRNIASAICLYDKRKKDIRDNHFTHDSIMKHRYPYRLEFRIYISNSNRLHLDNFQGSARQIFNRYIGYLAFLFNKYLRSNIEVKKNKNPELSKLMRTANEQTHYVRFTSKKLKTRDNEMIKDWVKTPVGNLFKELTKKIPSKKRNKLREKVLAVADRMVFVQRRFS